MESLSDIETLQKLLKRKILKVSTGAGSKPGDNYLSTIQGIEVVVEKCDSEETTTETLYFIAKVYPTNYARREYNNQRNIFYVEWAYYEHLIPALKKFASESGHEEMFGKMFAPFAAGAAVDLSSYNAKDLEEFSLQPYNELEQYILLTDVRKTGNYKMVNRLESLNVEHFSLLVIAIAKLHSFSWAYKIKKGIPRLSETEFPFLNWDLRANTKKIVHDMLEDGLKGAIEVFDTYLGKESKVSEGTRKLKGSMMKILYTYLRSGDNSERTGEQFRNIDKFLRIPPNQNEQEELWDVVLHGDCWVNNFLFRYDDAATQTPKDVVMVDFPLSREMCPTADLCNLIYTSTDAAFRKSHLESMLKLYFDEFNKYCAVLGVESLPGFSYDEFKRRLHRGKLYGYVLAISCLPRVLKESGESEDLEKAKNVKIESFFTSSENSEVNNDRFVKRLIELGQEMYTDGVI